MSVPHLYPANRLARVLFISLVISTVVTCRTAEYLVASDDSATSVASPKIGVDGKEGCNAQARRLKQLIITKPGVYENILVDGEWGSSTLVKIQADDVTLRHCEIRNGRHNAVTVYAKNVVIDSCKIHHVLKGSFDKQDDAHGITGCPTNLIVRNCDIGLVSGDCLQFDPGRGEWDRVLVVNCTLWTGPLPSDAGDFKEGQRPGENAVDTKQQAKHARSRLEIRNCLMSGWNQPAQIGNMAALNIKNHVEVLVANCVLRDNEICFRLRGGSGDYGGARVAIENCAVYDSLVAVRAEGVLDSFKVTRLGIGHGVKQKLRAVEGGPGPAYQSTGEYTPPAFDHVLLEGL